MFMTMFVILLISYLALGCFAKFLFCWLVLKHSNIDIQVISYDDIEEESNNKIKLEENKK